MNEPSASHQQKPRPLIFERSTTSQRPSCRRSLGRTRKRALGRRLHIFVIFVSEKATHHPAIPAKSPTLPPKGQLLRESQGGSRSLIPHSGGLRRERGKAPEGSHDYEQRNRSLSEQNRPPLAKREGGNSARSPSCRRSRKESDERHSCDGSGKKKKKSSDSST
ncbi:hypothetical protein BCR35DRAFT_23167 [Leucosporidium creatinivorum]|uniref:Uncharacterized protein n=1 Tax=Leucosporidium creatinivorum TaxID=106004 RepID=A0A1Y2FY48_9BASI|nr:hypothetical protein BCR35DRAFT_23167 [Leucosporidium creatinivorum]